MSTTPQSESWPWAGDPTRLRTDYDRDGFVHIPAFFTYDEVRELRAELDRYVRDVLPGLPAGTAVHEGGARDDSLIRFGQMFEHDAWFARLFRGGRLECVAALLLRRPVVGHNMQYFNKPGARSSVTPPHQDGAYHMIEPCEALNIWLALEDVDEVTGCVRYVRGSHRRGLRPHRIADTSGFSRSIVDYPLSEDLDAEVACPARAGDVLIHDALTIHRADPNRSALRSRQALGFVYLSDRAEHDAERWAAYQVELRSVRSAST